MLYIAQGNRDKFLSHDEIRNGLYKALDLIGKKNKVLVIPPDFTRFHSFAGMLTSFTWEYYRENLTDILPALGTHTPMTSGQIDKMFKDVPGQLFRNHDWRNDVVTLGEVPAEYIHEETEGLINYAWPAQVNRILMEGGHDLILSVGQVVPHEVIGMANYNKNIFVGTGGSEGINKSHFIGAVYGMERIMGRADNPVRSVLNYASDHFAKELPIVYVLTVVDKDKNGRLGVRGLYIGDDISCFHKASELSLEVNFTMLEKPLKKVVVYLDPSEYKSTWLGNKAIYRTRMAIEDNGELIILAPGVQEFGEDKAIDQLIRKYGYRNSNEVLALTSENTDLQSNLGAAAHLIHGSSEGRFTVTYCTKKVDKQDIENVHFKHAELDRVLTKYNPETLEDGFNLVDNEEIYYISNPALGLWAFKDRFK